MKNTFIAAVCLLGLLIGCTKTDVSGIWKGTLTAKSGVPINIEAMFNQDGKDLSGNLTIKKAGTHEKEGTQLTLTGSVDGDKLSFNTNFHSGLYIEFLGRTNKTTIRGDAEVKMQGIPPHESGTTETMELELTKE